MKTIDAQQNSIANIMYDAAKSRARAFETKSPASTKADPIEAKLQNRNIQDTVSLSKGGQKMVNLNNERKLAQQIKDAPIDENFAQTLKNATDDTFRITNLFTQSVRALFNWFR